jgi:hypothetical protein
VYTVEYVSCNRRALSSVTSGSPHSQEGNLDTEAGPDIADLDGFTEEEFRYDRYTPYPVLGKHEF